MKKTTLRHLCVIIIALLMVTCLGLSIVACDDTNIPDNNDGDIPNSTPMTTTFNKPNNKGKLNAYEVHHCNKDEQESEDNGQVFSNAINMDNEYYFYYFYLGSISKVPVYKSISLQYTFDTTDTFTFSHLTNESLSNSISKATEVIDTHSYTGGFEFDFEQEVEVSAGKLIKLASATFTTTQKLDHHWTQNWGSVETDSRIATQNYLSQYSKGYECVVNFSEAAGFTKGNYYRMAFYDTVGAYGVLAYEVATGTYSCTSEVVLQGNSTTRVWEESTNNRFSYEQSENLEFDISAAVEYVENNKDKIDLSNASSSSSSDNFSGDTTNFAGGDGSSEQPYIIANATHFSNISKSPSAYYVLQNDINLRNWNNNLSFSGNLNGNGHTIKYYQNVVAERKQYGLFTTLDNANVSNLQLEYNLSANKIGSNLTVGGLAAVAINNSKISQIFVNNNSEAYIDTDGVSQLGGIVGIFQGGQISQCANSANLFLGGRYNYCGGLVGSIEKNTNTIYIENCYNVGDIIVDGYGWTTTYGTRTAGGIVGIANKHSTRSINIINCYSSNSISLRYSTTNALAYRARGAMVGWTQGQGTLNFRNCYFDTSKETAAAWNQASCDGIIGVNNLSGSSYSGWSTDVWEFSNSAAPTLKWIG